MKKYTIPLIALALLSGVLLSEKKNMPQSGAEVKVLWDDPERQEFVPEEEPVNSEHETETESTAHKDSDAEVQIKVSPEILEYIKSYVPAVMQFLGAFFQGQITDEETNNQDAQENKSKVSSKALSEKPNNEWANIFESITGDNRG